MRQEQLPEPSPVDRHLQTLAGRLVSVPELKPAVDMIISDPNHASDVFNSYLELSGRLVDMDEADYDAIGRSQAQINGDLGSASTVGANDLKAELTDRGIDLLSVIYSSYESSSPYYKPAVDEVVSRMEGGHAMKVAGKTPSDQDPDSLKVIWGHTVITGHESLLHFVTMHYLERFMSKALADCGVPAALQKDFFINAMIDVVILNGLKNSDDPIFNLWVTPKDQGGLGWITQDRLKSYTDQ